MELIENKVFLTKGKIVDSRECNLDLEKGRKGTMTYRIMQEHNVGTESEDLKIKFDALASHDITYVGIVQTARASGLKSFPIPYAMTNCHNSLCAVGGTINEDDHVFGLSAAKKYGGIYVPANQAVIHTYVRESLADCGKMILGSDSHTRYGALGTMGIGEGGPELVKQLLSHTYDIKRPEVVLVYLKGKVPFGTGPHDVALSLVHETFDKGFLKNRVLEFVGPGLKELSIDFRCAIDVMTTETTCLSSIWETDDVVASYDKMHGRKYKKLEPLDGAMYDRAIVIDLSQIKPMIALPFHPSKAFTIDDINEHGLDILPAFQKEIEDRYHGKVKLDLMSKYHDGALWTDQGIIAGCSGGLFENICAAEAILKDQTIGNGNFSLSIYPGSNPIGIELTRDGVFANLMESGAIIKPAFCGPCFGAGDVPANNALSIRHTTRNFPNREGSKPSDGQLSGVALMDARSIAATARNGGKLTSAARYPECKENHEYHFDASIYKKRVYNGFGNPQPKEELIIGPNITLWPKMYPLKDNILLKMVAVIRDPVTTTDELIPSGETSSYRSNPLRLAEFTLSRRVPEYVERAKAVDKVEQDRISGNGDEVSKILKKMGFEFDLDNIQYSSCIYANRPGDGSAREQAASCQKVLGTSANIAIEYATKRYRSNCINWGIIPFTLCEGETFEGEVGSYVLVPNIKKALESGTQTLKAYLFDGKDVKSFKLELKDLAPEERQIILTGCLMNYYAVTDNRS